MTALKVGWFGTDIAQANVAQITDTVDGLQIKGRLSTSTLADVAVLRDQLIGLAQQPGLAVPVTIDTAPHLDGWYYVTDVSLDTDRGGFDIGWWPYTLTLQQAGRSLTPVLEARILGALRPNSQSRTTCVGWQAIPDGSTFEGGPSTLAAPTERATSDGAVRAHTAGSSGLLDAFMSWRTPAAVALTGGARVRAGEVASISSNAFGFSGASVSYVVPAGVARLRVDARGASGGGGGGVGGFNTYGRGARVVCELPVTPGETLTIKVGGTGAIVGGYNGGGNGAFGGSGIDGFGFGGGGRTQILRGATTLVTAGGGGGAGGIDADASRTLPGHGGSVGSAGADRGLAFAGSGKGGTSNAGGAGGNNTTISQSAGSAGAAGTGGAAGNSAGIDGIGGGGGGGGVYGGGGGQAMTTFVGDTTRRAAGSGGGGSSKGTGLSQSIVTGHQIGAGELFLTAVTDTLPVDRHTLTGYAIPDSPQGWELSNGLILVTPVYRSDAFMLDVSTWNGAGWSPPKRFWLTDNGSTSVPAAAGATGVAVLTNTPDRCTIQVTLEGSAKSAAYTTTLTLRRGSPLVEMRTASIGAKAFGVAATGASAAVTGGGRVASVADSAGNKWLMVAAQGGSAAPASHSGWFLATAAMSHTVGVGFLPAGFGATTESDLVAQWFAATTATIRAVKS